MIHGLKIEVKYYDKKEAILYIVHRMLVEIPGRKPPLYFSLKTGQNENGVSMRLNGYLQMPFENSRS